MEPYRLAANAARLPNYSPVARGGDPADISRSWQRCRSAGLIPEQSRLDAPHHSPAERRLSAERNAALITQARPVMEYFYSQIKDSGCVILLSDENGHLLDAAGDTDFCNRAAKVALTPGACWAEDQRGTNAIGTALIEGKPIVVNGTEHYLRSNNFLACAAAPLTASSGRLLGVIDISCDARIYHPHTFGLVRAAAQMIENRMFEIAFTHQTKLRFHMSSECLGSMMEGAIALNQDGKIIGANRAGFAMLGLRPADIGTRDAAGCFDLSFRELMDLQTRADTHPVAIRLHQGTVIHMRLETFHAPLRASPAIAPATAGDALNALDTGDAHIAKSIGQLRRVLGRKVPVLLQGETGTGKDFFARAIHATSPRALGPFVAVNCAALADASFESELFGHAAGNSGSPTPEGTLGRIREAQGGTLYLDAIDDMAPALQTRLLQVLEEGRVTPIGGQPVAVDFQLISALHDDVARRIAANHFRADLYYRLNGLTVTLPPLRERSDLAVLIERVLARECALPGRHPHLSPGLASACLQYGWPGNLRQLAGWLRTACLMLDDEEAMIDFKHLSEEAVQALTEQPARAGTSCTSLRAQSDAAIAEAVSQTGGNIAAAARHLGISRNTLYRRLGVARGA
jgi:transcriptional regulator of acetoin/glycerol metabolism